MGVITKHLAGRHDQSSHVRGAHEGVRSTVSPDNKFKDVKSSSSKLHRSPEGRAELERRQMRVANQMVLGTMAIPAALLGGSVATEAARPKVTQGIRRAKNTRVARAAREATPKSRKDIKEFRRKLDEAATPHDLFKKRLTADEIYKHL